MTACRPQRCAPEPGSQKPAKLVEAPVPQQGRPGFKRAGFPSGSGRRGRRYEGIERAEAANLAAARLQFERCGVTEMRAERHPDKTDWSFPRVFGDLRGQILDQIFDRKSDFGVTPPARVNDRLEAGRLGGARARERRLDAPACPAQNEYRG